MRSLKFTALLIAFVALLTEFSGMAYADTLQYTFSQTYPNQPTHTFSFDLPSNPTPDQLIVNAAQDLFAIKSVPATVDGTAGTYLVVFSFQTGSYNGGGSLVLAGPYYVPGEPTLTYLNVSGQPLYSGLPIAPNFLTGSFSLQEFGAPYGGALGTLQVTDVTTPEPSSLALLGTGLAGLAAFGLQKRTRFAR